MYKIISDSTTAVLVYQMCTGLCRMSASYFFRKDAKSDKRKKKLHNEACRGEKKLLEQVLIASSTKKLSEETNVHDAWLCYNCQSDLNKLEKLRKAVQELENYPLMLARTGTGTRLDSLSLEGDQRFLAVGVANSTMKTYKAG